MNPNPKTTISNFSVEMLTEWAKRQGILLLKRMEAQKLPQTISLDWTKLKSTWLGGFISGVNCGFNLGFETAKKLETKKDPEDEGTEEVESEESEDFPEPNPDQMEFAI